MHEVLYVIKINRETEDVYPRISIILPEPTNLQSVPKIPKENLSSKQLSTLRLYWQYSESRFYQIYDYFSFQTFRLLSSSKVMYAVFDNYANKTQSDEYIQYDSHLIKKIVHDKKGLKKSVNVDIPLSDKILKPRQVNLKTSSGKIMTHKTYKSILVEEYANAKFLEDVKHGFKVDPLPKEAIDLFPHAPKKRGIDRKDKKDKKDKDKKNPKTKQKNLKKRKENKNN